MALQPLLNNELVKNLVETQIKIANGRYKMPVPFNPVFLGNLIGTFVENCQRAVFMCFSMLMHGVFKYIFYPRVTDMRD